MVSVCRIYKIFIPEKQPKHDVWHTITSVVPASNTRFAATSDLVIDKHGAEDSASQQALWHARGAARLFARHLQPLYLLVTALSSRLAVASNRAVAELARNSNHTEREGTQDQPYCTCSQKQSTRARNDLNAYFSMHMLAFWTSSTTSE